MKRPRALVRRIARRLKLGWSRLAAHPGFMPRIEMGLAGLALAVGLMSYLILTRAQAPATGLSPPQVTVLLIVNLVPLMAVLVLIARRVALLLANRRARVAGANLHVRLVSTFAALAAIPTILVVVFASLLFQFGVQFWFSDKARTVLDNADRVAQAYVEDARERILEDSVAMAGDITGYAADFGLGSADFRQGLAFQVAARNLSEAAVFQPAGNGERVIASVSLRTPGIASRLAGVELARLAPGGAAVLAPARDRVEAVVRLDRPGNYFVYASRAVEPRVLEQVARTQTALSDYRALTERSRNLQWRFNLILLFVSLLIVAIAIWLALWLATRMVAPVQRLAEAAERVGGGDFDARVPVSGGGEEFEKLAQAFNRMTGQIKGQQMALMAASSEAEGRRRFFEAILSGVSAGVLSLGTSGVVRLANRSAALLLHLPEERLIGRPLARAVPELAAFLETARAEGTAGGEVVRRLKDGTQTLAVRLTADPGEGRGYILTFDDISQQLADQRRAAWSDVARRIAHEIRNPLTPIMLSAERLQRRFASQIEDGRDTFEALTSTITRQTEDLRRMVDEFSAFARMPTPTFRPEDIVAVARDALFLAEVAAPSIRFSLEAGDVPPFVCDRRQMGQAFTNLLKNAIEAIQAGGCDGTPGGDRIDIAISADHGRLRITLTDTGCGLPGELRERLFEPYVTTRERGTGLGLAIVKRIVEDHRGQLELANRPGGDRGTIARMEFDLEATAEAADPGGTTAAAPTDDAAPKLPAKERA